MTSSTITKSGEYSTCALWTIFMVIIAFIIAIIALLGYFCYVFATIITGDPTYKNVLSIYPMEKETAIEAAKLYFGFSVTILSLLIFQLTTFSIAFKFEINTCFVYTFFVSVFVNAVLSVVYYFIADDSVKIIPFLTFWVSLGMLCIPAKTNYYYYYYD